MTNAELPDNFHNILDDIQQGVERQRTKYDALENSELTTDQIRIMAIDAAGRLMANQTLDAGEQLGARAYLEGIFHNLDRIENPQSYSNNFPEGSNEWYSEQFRYRDHGRPVPALAWNGAEFTAANGLIKTGAVLLDADHQRKVQDKAASMALSPAASGVTWTHRQLADIYDHKINHLKGK